MSTTKSLNNHKKLLTMQSLDQCTFSAFEQQTGQCDCACAVTPANMTQITTSAIWESRLAALPTPIPIAEGKSTWLQTQPLTVPLSAWLHITDRCTLRCAYCYLPHKPTDMSLMTGRAAIHTIFRSALAHNYKAVKIKYSGGEPLLRFPTVLKLHHQAQVLSEQYGIILDGIILSNGTLLTIEIAKQIKSSGLRLMVSLDGLGIYHDCQRPYADGRGSYNDVAKNVDLLLAKGLVPQISITVSGRNAQGLPKIVAWALERNLPFSLNFYRQNPLSFSHKDLQLEENCIIEGMLAAYRVIAQHLPSRSLLISLADHTNLATPHLRTCNAGQDYIVFDTQGQISKCQMDMAHPITDCQDPDPLSTIRSSTVGLQNPSVETKIECQNCEWRYWCGGGCPLQNYRTKGSYMTKSPNCNIYKTLFPEIIRLESLRLNKLDQIAI